jgi:hypothetical protein
MANDPLLCAKRLKPLAEMVKSQALELQVAPVLRKLSVNASMVAMNRCLV